MTKGSPPYLRAHNCTQGFRPVYGARPLKRFLQRALETPLSRQLIAGDIADHSHVTVDFRDGELVFAGRAGSRK